MKNHPTSNKRLMATGVGVAIMLALVLGFSPRVLKANSSKPDLMGNLASHASASCTPTPTPTPGPTPE